MAQLAAPERCLAQSKQGEHVSLKTPENPRLFISGPYFVTICSDFNRCTFGQVAKGKVELSALGQIAEGAWVALPRRVAGIRLCCHVVMPNHVHGIIEILSGKLAQQAAPLQRRGTAKLSVRRVSSLSIIVRSFKADVTRRAHSELNWAGQIWQRNFFDRVIRDGREFSNAERYISENPVRWEGQQKRWAEGEATRNKSAQQAAPVQR